MKDGELHTASRGGSNYDVAATYILQDAYIKSLFENNPNLILDGELYNHNPSGGWNLQKISGLGRLETLHPDHSQLRFYCYDFVDENKTFKERWDFLKSLNVPWNSLLTIVEHVEACNNDEINKLHDDWVANGYEGLVMRDPDKTYKSNCRDRRMQKLKRFSDLDAIITGISEGLRDEDFVFTMKLGNGIEFEAKPIGDRELKRWYRENLDNIIGEYGTVKYFNITPDGKPNLPVFLRVRDKKDM